MYVVEWNGDLFGPFMTNELARYFIVNQLDNDHRARIRLLRSAK